MSDPESSALATDDEKITVIVEAERTQTTWQEGKIP